MCSMAVSIDRTVGVGGVTVGLIGTGIVVLWPDKRWLGWVFIALGFLIAVLAIVWTLAVYYTRRELEADQKKPAWIREAELINAPITNTNNPIFAPVFAPSFNQSQAQTQEQSVTPTPAIPQTAESEIECTDCYFGEAHLSGSNRLSNYSDGIPIGESGGGCNVAQAKFYLKPIPGSEPSMELRTRLIFYDATGSHPIRRVSDGVWRETVNFIHMPLSTGDTRTLVVAVEAPNVGFGTYEYAERHIGRRRFNREGIFTHILSPKIEPLSGDDLTVQVFLTGKSAGDVTLNQEFWFRLSRPKLEITQISSPRGIQTDMKTQF